MSQSSPAADLPPSPHGARVTLFITSDQFGAGPEELGRILMRGFLKTCLAQEVKPWRAVFVNNGIRLTTQGSPLLQDLRALEEAGVEILSCGTCLDYFQAKERLGVGRVSNMNEIVQTLTLADRVLRP